MSEAGFELRLSESERHAFHSLMFTAFCDGSAKLLVCHRPKNRLVCDETVSILSPIDLCCPIWQPSAICGSLNSNLNELK